MKTFDVWLYRVTVEANTAGEAERDVAEALDIASKQFEAESSIKDILERIQVDFAEEIV